MSGTQIGTYQVLGTLGTGAHSKILQIRRSADAKNYALKVVLIQNPEESKFLQQAQHEFRVAQMLDHPNLIKIFALETQRNWLFRVRKLQLLIEYVNGRTLDTLNPQPVPKLVQLFARVASGMVHMHARRVYHADLKPNNIMLSRSGEVKIIDYGLAWIKGESKNRLQGTPEYMAPEQARKAVVNEQSDIYNFGATMYRLTTWRYPPNILAKGEMPLDSKSWADLIRPVEQCNAMAPTELCDLIHHCLAFKPANRPEKMSQVKEVLDCLSDRLVKTTEDHLETISWD